MTTVTVLASVLLSGHKENVMEKHWVAGVLERSGASLGGCLGCAMDEE